MNEVEVVRALAALAQSLRLRVFRLLVVAGKTGLTPGAIAEALEVPAATLSFHLKDLMHSGLITQERNGRHLIYRASFEHMDQLLGYLTSNCCRDELGLVEAGASCGC